MEIPTIPTDELHKFRVISGLVISAIAALMVLALYNTLDSRLRESNDAFYKYLAIAPPSKAHQLKGKEAEAATEASGHYDSLEQSFQILISSLPFLGAFVLVVFIFGLYQVIIGLQSWKKHQSLRDEYTRLQVEFIRGEVHKQKKG